MGPCFLEGKGVWDAPQPFSASASSFEWTSTCRRTRRTSGSRSSFAHDKGGAAEMQGVQPKATRLLDARAVRGRATAEMLREVHATTRRSQDGRQADMQRVRRGARPTENCVQEQDATWTHARKAKEGNPCGGVASRGSDGDTGAGAKDN